MHTYILAQACTRTYRYSCIAMHKHIRTGIHTQTCNSHMHRDTHVCTQKMSVCTQKMSVCMHLNTHEQTCINIYRHVSTHVHVSTLTYRHSKETDVTLL